MNLTDAGLAKSVTTGDDTINCNKVIQYTPTETRFYFDDIILLHINITATPNGLESVATGDPPCVQQFDNPG